jgi:ribA/ribD-fused uncharacterized protein
MSMAMVKAETVADAIRLLGEAAELIETLYTRTNSQDALIAELDGCHGLDTPERVCFYEQDFYVLSNFSSFTVYWCGQRFDTSEALYHWLKFASGLGMFDGHRAAVAESIRTARSAHEAFKVAQEHKDMRRDDWDDVKVSLMKRILHEKARQHEYVLRKLLATGDRELVENSWRDDFWGWGPNRDGQNMLGKLWMEVREELRATLAKVHPHVG